MEETLYTDIHVITLSNQTNTGGDMEETLYTDIHVINFVTNNYKLERLNLLEETWKRVSILTYM